MALVDSYRSQRMAVDRSLRLLSALEQDIREGRRSDPNEIRAVSTLSASIQIQFYGIIEESFRQALAHICVQIAADKLAYPQLEVRWRNLWLRDTFLIDLQNGTNYSTHLAKLDRHFGPLGRSHRMTFAATRLPFPGNVNHEKLIAFCNDLGLSIAVPDKARGGSDLESIRVARNELSHGLRLFEESQVSHSDLIERFARVDLFFEAILDALEGYAAAKRFKFSPVAA